MGEIRSPSWPRRMGSRRHSRRVSIAVRPGEATMLRGSNGSQSGRRQDGFDPVRVGVGSTRPPFFRRKGVGARHAGIGRDDRVCGRGTSRGTARLRLVPGQPGFTPDRFALSADGTMIATTDLDGSVALRDSRNGWAFERFPTASGYVHSASLSPDGRFLVCTADGSSVDLYDWHSRGRGGGCRCPSNVVHRVEYAPDGRSIAMASECGGPTPPLGRDRRSCLIVAARRRPGLGPGLLGRRALPRIGRDPAQFRNHPLGPRDARSPIVEKGGPPVTALALSRDGRWLATARGYGRFVRIWDATSSTLTRELDGRRTRDAGPRLRAGRDDPGHDWQRRQGPPLESVHRPAGGRPRRRCRDPVQRRFLARWSMDRGDGHGGLPPAGVGNSPNPSRSPPPAGRRLSTASPILEVPGPVPGRTTTIVVGCADGVEPDSSMARTIPTRKG